MSRIEKNADVESHLTRMKGEVIQAVRRSGRGSPAAAGLFLALGLITVCLLGGLIWMGIASGFITVPQALLEWYQQQRV
jgi:hypothetical protein